MNQKVLPCPGSLRTPICPPMAVTMRRHNASPSPAPPKRRVADPSACTKGWNKRAWVAVSIPIPESATSKRRTEAASSVPRTRPARATTVPAGVNLTALPRRLRSTWRSRAPSPRSSGGTSSATSDVT